MNPATILLNAYYESLYELLSADKKLLIQKITKLLHEEIKNSDFGKFDSKKFGAYHDACIAFLDERLEMYNPVGTQYLFDRLRSHEATELEFQLNWYDSQDEFQKLTESAQHKAHHEMTEQQIQELAGELILECGAFPDKSIIEGYKAVPNLQKLPDYILAVAVEDLIR